MDIKLVDYSESSSESDQASNVESSDKKVAIVQPVQQIHIPDTEPEHQSPTEEERTNEDNTEIQLEPDSLTPEPAVIEVSSDSETISIGTDTTFGKHISHVLKISVIFPEFSHYSLTIFPKFSSTPLFSLK